jgi:hypothetical protein
MLTNVISTQTQAKEGSVLTASKFSLVCITAVMAMALVASPVPAQERPVEIVEEPSGEPCDPCIGHAVGESELEFFGIPISSCEDEFEGEAYADGSGHIYDYENNHLSSPSCTRIACNGVGEAPAEVEWDASNSGETGPNEGHSNVRFCLDNENNPNGAGLHCTAEVLGFEQGSHGGIASADFVCPNGIHVIGEWTGETDTHNNAEALHEDG